MRAHAEIDEAIEEREITQCIKELAPPLNKLLKQSSRKAVATALMTHLSCALEAMLRDGSSWEDIEAFMQELKTPVLEVARASSAGGRGLKRISRSR